MVTEDTSSDAVPSALKGELGRSIPWKGPVEGYLQNTFGDLQIASSESETLFGDKDPWIGHATDGTEFYRISNPRLTKVRASLVTGGYRCWWTFAGGLKVAAWHTDYLDYPPVRWQVSLLNSDGGILIQTKAEHHMICHEETTLFISQDFNPDVYDIFKNFYMENEATRFFVCH